MKLNKNSLTIFSILDANYPHVNTFLTHRNPYELLVAVILSAQCTDARVNIVTPALFKQFPTPQKMAEAHLADVQHAIRSINFFNAKAKNLIAMANQLVDRFDGKVPRTMEDLTSLPGVGRKTANVILAQAYHQPAITVDTHVKRVTYRLGFHTADDPTKIEFRLQKLWPPKTWDRYCIVLILHGRTICHARRPQCSTCPVTHLCPKRGVNINLSKLKKTGSPTSRG